MKIPSKTEALEALKLLDNATAQLPLNRNDHSRVINAVQTLNQYIAALTDMQVPPPQTDRV